MSRSALKFKIAHWEAEYSGEDALHSIKGARVAMDAGEGGKLDRAFAWGRSDYRAGKTRQFCSEATQQAYLNGRKWQAKRLKLTT